MPTPRTGPTTVESPS